LKASFLIIFLTLLTNSFIYAQENITSRLDWLDANFANRHQDDTHSVIDSLKKEVLKHAEANDKAGEAYARKELGLTQLMRIPQYDTALLNFIRCLEIEDSLSLTAEQVITYLAMAKVFEEVSDFQKSLELLDNATEVSRPLNDPNILVYILNAQGRINTLMRRHDQAFENYQLVLKTKDQLASRKQEGWAYFNLGDLHQSKGKLQDALSSYIQALEIWRDLKDKPAEAKTLNHIGNVYSALKNYAKAHANHLVALKIRLQQNNDAELAESYNNIGILYFNQGNFERAIANLFLGLEKAKASQSAELTARSYEFLSACYKQLNDFKTALEYEESYVRMLDFLRAEKIEHELVEKQNRSVLEKKESKIRELQVQKRERELMIESQRKTQNFLTILVGLGIVIVLLVLYLYLVKRRANISLEAAHARVNRQNEQLQNLNATKDKFFSIISHDLKGPLNSFTAFSGMLINHTESLTKEEIQLLAKEIDKNLKNLFSLLENLLEWSRSQTGNIEFKPEVFDLNELVKENHALLAAQAKNKQLNLQFTSEGVAAVNAHRHSVNTVIRNLISNAIKFTPEGGSVTIRALRQGESYRFEVKDTGVGMAEDVLKKLFRIDVKYSTQGTANEKGTGLGLILCKDFIEKNGGTIGVESQPGVGSTFFFILPAFQSQVSLKAAEKLGV
jgi:signal transduction histidine kinase